MASAERDRLELTARIEQLERENAELESKNKAVTDENRNLREELEQLNDTVKEAETKIDLLEVTLRDSQREVRDLEHAAERAASLERQIAVLEEEQVALQATIVRTQEEARTAVYRWRQAEKGLNDLQEQLERMEKEAREERERHVEVISRIERQRAVEKELNTAAGRLKGAAAMKSLTESRSGGNVVSHFVRDLLQDNANLQVGIAELREMLLNSHDEIQMLREQLMYHQPAASHEPCPRQTLQAELEKKEPPTPPPQATRLSQELHIHHHYHVSPKPDIKKHRKRRQGLTPATFNPPHMSAPASPLMSPIRWQPILSSPANSSSAPSAANRWSLESTENPSSGPCSPQSANRNSVFDRVPDVASPGTPASSLDPTSPSWHNTHRYKTAELSLRSISETAMFPTHQSPTYRPRPRPSTRLARGVASPYTTDDVPSATSASLAGCPDYDGATEAAAEEALSPTSTHFDPSGEKHPRVLQRVVSHESIMSLSNGMDIHTLKVRPSQLALRPLGLTAAGTNLSDVTAQPTLLRGSRGGKRGSVILRDSIAQAGLPQANPRTGEGGSRTASNPARAGARDRDRGSSRAPSALGKLVSWRPWGAGNNNNNNSSSSSSSTNNRDRTSSSNNNTNATDTQTRTSTDPFSETRTTSKPIVNPPSASANNTTTAPSTVPPLSLPASAVPVSLSSSPSRTPLSKSPQHGSVASSVTTTTTATATAFRAPGINQPGVVPGFHQCLAAAHQKRGVPSRVAVEDAEGVREAMREVLEGA